MQKHKDADREIISRENNLRDSHSVAYRYHAFINDITLPVATEKGTEKGQYISERFELRDPKYSYRRFEMWNFAAPVGADSELNVVSGTKFEYCVFDNCIFENIIFRDCCFFGNAFDNVRFMNVVFEDCRFSHLSLMETEETSEWIGSGNIFTSCAFWGGFVNHTINESLTEKDIENNLFDKCMFFSINIERCSLKNTVFDNCVTYDMKMKDCDLRGFGIKDIDRLEISFEDDRGTFVDESTVIDWDISVSRKEYESKTPSSSGFNHYDDMCITKSKTLMRFSRLFGRCGLSAYEGEYFYRSKLTEQKGLHSWAKVKSFVSLALCGYGERPSYTLFTILGMIFLFGIMYMFTGISTGPATADMIMYPSHTGVSFISDMGKCLFFSITNFSTVGYGNYVPIGTASSILSAIQMLMGVGLCALWTGCIFRKMSR
ncbi:MAG: hypothetical protein E7218_09010 [Anaerofustis stercorihominis]|nr:hypothetical protein [Anaerofustis stercorihominis]